MLLFRFSGVCISALIKKFIFTISIIFLNSFIFASKNGSLFQYKTINGIEWKSFGEPKINPMYEGSIENNKPNGEGKLTYSNRNYFKGFWKDGKLHGEGAFFWSDGKKYKGLFKNGIPKGRGTYYYENGSKKSGKWEDTRQNFLWEKKASDTLLVRNKKKGVLSYRKENARWGWFDYGDEGKDGKYIGEIENLKPNGYGTFTYGIGKWKGDKYEGMWKNGSFDGQGTLIRKNGEKFTGEWKNNNLWNISKYSKFGKILRKYVNGKEIPIKYKILMKKKKLTYKKEKGILFMYTPRSLWEGMGKKWYFSGDEKKHGKYEGEILNGLPNGQGIYSWFNVNKYIGEFKNGMFHGQGTFYSLPSGIKIVGEFRKDKEWNALQKDGKGKIIGNFVNGELRKK